MLRNQLAMELPLSWRFTPMVRSRGTVRTFSIGRRPRTLRHIKRMTTAGSAGHRRGKCARLDPTQCPRFLTVCAVRDYALGEIAANAARCFQSRLGRRARRSTASLPTQAVANDRAGLSCMSGTKKIKQSATHEGHQPGVKGENPDLAPLRKKASLTPFALQSRLIPDGTGPDGTDRHHAESGEPEDVMSKSTRLHRRGPRLRTLCEG